MSHLITIMMICDADSKKVINGCPALLLAPAAKPKTVDKKITPKMGDIVCEC